MEFVSMESATVNLVLLEKTALYQLVLIPVHIMGSASMDFVSAKRASLD
jgi:hypothetical protein